MSDLVSLTEFDTWLGGAVAGETVLRTGMLDQVETRFERECGRSAVPFQEAEAGRVEYRDGVGGNVLFLDYPVTALTSITLGFDHSNPTETLVVADLLYAVGSRRVVRLNGWFGCFGDPRYIKVTYDAAADLPEDAKLAVLGEAARLYRSRGSEEVKSETMGPYSVTYATAVTGGGQTDWDRAVANHARVI